MNVLITKQKEPQSVKSRLLTFFGFGDAKDAVNRNHQRDDMLPVGVLMGQIGTGKTTLLNKMCGTRHKASVGAHSNTRRLFKEITNQGADSFELIDTPGTDSEQETYKHAVLLREALTASEINTIFIIVKYENRYEKMQKNYLQAYAPVVKYEKKIVVMVSHWDLKTDAYYEQREIVKQLGMHCTNMMFYSKDCDSDELANAMYACLLKMPKERLEIPDEEFFMNFNIYDFKYSMTHDYFRLQKDLHRLEREMSKLSKSSEIAAQEKDEFLHSLIVTFSIESENLLKEFQDKYQHEMIDLDQFVSWIKLEKECIELNDLFTQKMSELMTYNLNDKQDPRNMIRKCPKCHEIWFKTEGCNGRTICGNRVQKSRDILKKGWLKFVFIRKDDGSFKFTKQSMAPIQENENQASYVEEGGAGCGASFWWRFAPKVEEAKILELFQAKSIDEVKQMLKNKDFEEERERTENQIDKTFYSSTL